MKTAPFWLLTCQLHQCPDLQLCAFR